MLYFWTSQKAFLSCKIMKGNVVSRYIKESMGELSKVTWPTKNKAVRLTIIVLIFTLVFAVFLGVLDYLFQLLYDYVLTIV